MFTILRFVCLTLLFDAFSKLWLSFYKLVYVCQPPVFVIVVVAMFLCVFLLLHSFIKRWDLIIYINIADEGDDIYQTNKTNLPDHLFSISYYSLTLLLQSRYFSEFIFFFLEQKYEIKERKMFMMNIFPVHCEYCCHSLSMMKSKGLVVCRSVWIIFFFNGSLSAHRISLMEQR